MQPHVSHKSPHAKLALRVPLDLWYYMGPGAKTCGITWARGPHVKAKVIFALHGNSHIIFQVISGLIIAITLEGKIKVIISLIIEQSGNKDIIVLPA